MNSVCRVSIVIALINRCDVQYDAGHEKKSVQSVAKPDRFTLQNEADTEEYVRC